MNWNSDVYLSKSEKLWKYIFFEQLKNKVHLEANLNVIKDMQWLSSMNATVIYTFVYATTSEAH